MILSISGRLWSQLHCITLLEGTKIIQEERELAKKFNKFFINIVKNLRINENLLSTSETRCVDPIISKTENHPGVVTVRNCFDKNSAFSFKETVKAEVIKEIKKFEIQKGSLSSDIFTKIMKQFSDLFAILLPNILIFLLQNILTLLKLIQPIGKWTLSRKKTTELLAFYVISQKFMRELCIIKLMISL